VLWAYKTTKRIPMGDTSFSLAYKTETIIPVNICMPTLCTRKIDQSQNTIQLCFAQDQLGERRQQAQIRITAYQQEIKVAHHKKVKPHEFRVGDLILKRVIQSTKEKKTGKLRPNWEDPYFVVAKGGKIRTP